ncbi:MAG: tetratricopeptide repeat protein, partial [Myxococcales bacterium]|nr:tetratricopeptide repeat protein [Myxococcales bacterium]
RRRQGLDDNGRRMAAAPARAASARPAFHAALVALAALRARSGNDRRAVELYGRALALCPGDTRTLHGMALAQIGLGRADRALAFLDRAIAIDDDDPDALTSRALVLAIFKRATPRALADSTAARTRRGKRGDAARVELAAAYAQLLAHRAKNCLSGVRRARPKLDPERRPAYAQIVDTLEAACHLAARQMPAAKRINARLAKARKANTAIARQLTLLWRRVLSDLQVRLRALR